jgi:hypothetical protein
MFSTSTIIFTEMSVIASVGRTAVYGSRRLKKLSILPKRSTRASWLASTSLATCDSLQCRNSFQTLRLTKRRTPTPAKITCAGENTCNADVKGCRQVAWIGLTRPTPPPSVAEYAYRTLMVGFSHRDNRSSAVLDRSNSLTLS